MEWTQRPDNIPILAYLLTHQPSRIHLRTSDEQVCSSVRLLIYVLSAV